MVGSEDLLQIFERAYLFKRGQVEHVWTMANVKLKPSLFMPCPIMYTTTKKMIQVPSHHIKILAN